MLGTQARAGQLMVGPVGLAAAAGDGSKASSYVPNWTDENSTCLRGEGAGCTLEGGTLEPVADIAEALPVWAGGE